MYATVFELYWRNAYNTQPSQFRVPLATRILRCWVILNSSVADPRILLAHVEVRRLRYVAKKKMMIHARAILHWPLPVKVKAVVHTVDSLVIHTEPDPSVIRNGNGVQVAQEFQHAEASNTGKESVDSSK